MVKIVVQSRGRDAEGGGPSGKDVNGVGVQASGGGPQILQIF